MRPQLAEDIYSDEAEAKRQALRADVDLFLREELSSTQTQALLAQAKHDEDLAAYIEHMRAIFRRHEALLKSGLI